MRYLVCINKNGRREGGKEGRKEGYAIIVELVCDHGAVFYSRALHRPPGHAKTNAACMLSCGVYSVVWSALFFVHT